MNKVSYPRNKVLGGIWGLIIFWLISAFKEKYIFYNEDC